MNELDSALKEKLHLLENWFRQRIGSLVAFSGGIDSTLVLFLSRKFQGRDCAIGVISNSESLKNKDFILAKSFCEDFDIQLRIMKRFLFGKSLQNSIHNQLLFETLHRLILIKPEMSQERKQFRSWKKQ